MIWSKCRGVSHSLGKQLGKVETDNDDIEPERCVHPSKPLWMAQFGRSSSGTEAVS